MPVVNGRVTRINSHQEEGRTDWALALSKIGWFIIFLLTPLSLFRFVNDFFGIIVAGISIFLLLIFLRLIGPFNLVMLDEIICRVFPSLRTAFRTGRVRVVDFRVKTEQGEQIACILRGDLQGQSPMKGDEVSVNGIFLAGTLHVEDGRNATTNSTFSPRRCHTGLLLILTIGLISVFCLYLNGVFDEWLYPIVEEFLIQFLEEA